MPLPPRRIGDGERGPATLSVNGTDRKTRARQGGLVPRASRRLNTAAPIRPNLDMRLEHELQTVVWQQRSGAAAISQIAYGIGAIAFQQHLALLVHASRARLRLSWSSRVSASLARSAAVGAARFRKPLAFENYGARGVRKRHPPGSRSLSGGAISVGLAGCPNATQPEPKPSADPSYGPRRGIGKSPVGFGLSRPFTSGRNCPTSADV